VSEILATQPEPLQRFLLQTSVLSRLSGSLCDALTEREDSASLLEFMEQAGLFLEALDVSEAAERWYRYHALFAEAMQAEARRRLGVSALRALSHKASRWFEQHEMPVDAVEAALQAQDVERIAELIKRLVEAQHLNSKGEHFIIGEYHTLCRWLEHLPEDVLKRHPALCFSFANALWYTFVLGEIPLSPAKVLRIEQCLHMAQEGWQRASNTPRLGEVFAFRALLARQYGAIEEAVKLAHQSLAYLPEDTSMWGMISLGVLGTSVLHSGQLNVARQMSCSGTRPFMLCKDVHSRDQALSSSVGSA
jgi:LuxR family transcriptional regulator, maltose regulon positive regulatory protein